MMVIVNPKMSFTVKYGGMGFCLCFYLVLMGYLILFGVETVGGLFFCIRTGPIVSLKCHALILF